MALTSSTVIAAVVVVAVVIASVPFLLWYTRKRHWNVDHEDDARRPPP